MRAPEQPLFFASGEHRLYGVYHPPATRKHGAVVLHVHGLGVEQITSYRTEVLCARALADAGIPVLRYHARGHGDSTGNFAEVTLETLAEDAGAAADHARRVSGATRIVWLGVRFGALAAARALAGRDDTAGLALWEPAERGGDYFRGLLRGMLFSQVAAGHRPDRNVEQLLAEVEQAGQVDVHGYYLHRALVRSASEVTLAGLLGPWSGPTLLAQLQERGTLAAPHEALFAELRERGAPLQSFLHREDPGWYFIQNPAWECPPLIQITRDWIDALA